MDNGGSSHRRDTKEGAGVKDRRWEGRLIATVSILLRPAS
jgi:hypothetical protein